MNIAHRFNLLSLRERVAVNLSLALLLVCFWALFVRSMIEDSMGYVVSNIDYFQVSISHEAAVNNEEDIQYLYQYLDDLKAKETGLSKEIDDLGYLYMDNEKVISIIGDFIGYESLEMINYEMLSIDDRYLSELLKHNEEIEGDSIYGVGLNVRLMGSFDQFLGFLEKLEGLSKKILWRNIGFSRVNENQILIDIKVYFLSMEKWYFD